jgi:tripartite-type tricarboxylate transporter receptor subunit TctC
MSSHLNRRALLAAASLGVLQWPGAVRAQAPDTLHLLCGYPPGGGPDIVTRKLAEKVSRRTGAAALVENKPGAAGRLAVGELKKAPPDGNTLLLTPASVMTMYPHVYRQLGYDVFTDVQPVCTVAATAFALAIGPKVPGSVTDFPSFVRWCRANRASAQCGNAGSGSMPHFMAILMAREAGMEIDHIPYRGGVPALQATAAAEIACAITTEGAARPLQQAGKLRVLATTAMERTATFPAAPTFHELGVRGMVHREWFGVFVPGRTPAAAVSSLADLLLSTLADADVRDVWAKAGLAAEGLGPRQLQLALRREHDFWGLTIRSSGFTPES